MTSEQMKAFVLSVVEDALIDIVSRYDFPDFVDHCETSVNTLVDDIHALYETQ